MEKLASGEKAWFVYHGQESLEMSVSCLLEVHFGTFQDMALVLAEKASKAEPYSDFMALPDFILGTDGLQKSITNAEKEVLRRIKESIYEEK